MKRASKTAPTRERILDEVERLIALHGVSGFTLRDVAEPLHLQVPAIYKHYENRDDVIVGVARRFVDLLAAQFQPSAALTPAAALRSSLNRFVEFKTRHPAYVRLALVDFATPEGGMKYVKRAAGGSLKNAFVDGPLSAMHRRLRSQLAAGVRTGDFRRVNATDFYGVVTAALLLRMVFPNDDLLLRSVTRAEVRAVQTWLWDVAGRYLAPRKSVRLS